MSPLSLFSNVLHVPKCKFVTGSLKTYLPYTRREIEKVPLHSKPFQDFRNFQFNLKSWSGPKNEQLNWTDRKYS